jgi:hypothetical protein
MENFRLSDAVLFAVGEAPMTKTARRTAEAVNLGKIVEKIVPFHYELRLRAGRLPSPVRAHRLPHLLRAGYSATDPAKLLR